MHMFSCVLREMKTVSFVLHFMIKILFIHSESLLLGLNSLRRLSLRNTYGLSLARAFGDTELSRHFYVIVLPIISPSLSKNTKHQRLVCNTAYRTRVTWKLYLPFSIAPYPLASVKQKHQRSTVRSRQVR